MKKKLFVSSIAVALLLTMTLVLLTGCGGFKKDPLTDFDIPETKLGLNSSVVGDTEAINDSMSAFQMLEVATRNFYNADYAVINYQGGVNMKLLGAISVDQEVQSVKIRDGKGDASGNNVNGATYFADNKSYSTFAKLYEKMVIGSDNSVQWRNAEGTGFKRANGKSRPNDVWSVKSWNDIDSSFTSLADANDEKSFLNQKSNNPTVLWMYDLKEEYVDDSIAPIYDPESKTYRFAIDFMPEESTVEYIKTMKAQLEGNAGMPVEDLNFLQLQLEVVLWENGTFRSITVKECYSMTMVLTAAAKLKNTVIKLTATQYFSYDRNEEGYDIASHIADFSNESHLVD